MKTVTACPENRDESGLFPITFVTLSVTSLFYHTYQAKPAGKANGGSHDAA